MQSMFFCFLIIKEAVIFLKMRKPIAAAYKDQKRRWHNADGDTPAKNGIGLRILGNRMNLHDGVEM